MGLVAETGIQGVRKRAAVRVRVWSAGGANAGQTKQPQEVIMAMLSAGAHAGTCERFDGVCGSQWETHQVQRRLWMGEESAGQR